MGNAIYEWPRLIRQCFEYVTLSPIPHEIFPGTRDHNSMKFFIPRAGIQTEKQSSTDRYFTRHTTPGGWVECIDLDLELHSPDNTLTPDLATTHFKTTFLKASRENNLEPCPGPRLEGWLKDAGFKDIAVEKHAWPVGTWPADKHLVRRFPTSRHIHI